MRIANLAAALSVLAAAFSGAGVEVHQANPTQVNSQVRSKGIPVSFTAGMTDQAQGTYTNNSTLAWEKSGRVDDFEGWRS